MEVRVDVGHENRPPNNVVGLLRMRFTDGNWYHGSGVLIDSRHVLTCAHNLTDQGQNPHSANEIRFYRAWNQHPLPIDYGLFQSVQCAFYPTAYQQGEDAWDVGIVRLNHPIQIPGQQIYYFQPQTVVDNSLVGQMLAITGYPGVHNGEMWEDVDQVAGIHLQTNTLLYTNDTLKGSSGSPIYWYDSVQDVVRQYAIHVSRQAQELRRGVLLTTVVKAWIDQARQTNFGGNLLQGL